MNQPEYILSEVLREVTASTSATLTATDAGNFPNALHFEHCYAKELDENLVQWQRSENKRPLKFPIVWCPDDRPDEQRGMLDFYSIVKGCEVYFLNNTSINWKADERDTRNYNRIIYPIYREWMVQLFFHPALTFSSPVANVQGIIHTKKKYPYYGEGEKSALTDPVDCLKLRGLEFKIKNNQNCS